MKSSCAAGHISEATGGMHRDVRPRALVLMAGVLEVEGWGVVVSLSLSAGCAWAVACNLLNPRAGAGLQDDPGVAPGAGSGAAAWQAPRMRRQSCTSRRFRGTGWGEVLSVENEEVHHLVPKYPGTQVGNVSTRVSPYSW